MPAIPSRSTTPASQTAQFANSMSVSKLNETVEKVRRGPSNDLHFVNTAAFDILLSVLTA